MEMSFSCPVPSRDSATIVLAHGGGGRTMRELLDRLILPAFDSSAITERHDAAVLSVPGPRIAFTSDSYVVTPQEFPGGDIGDLAVNGTINDLAMAGARPLWLAASFILEEGCPMALLERVVASMARAAKSAGVAIVTGDTKVVDRGKGDRLFVNTAGIGAVEHTLSICPASVRSGDAVIVSGDIGRHGIAIMAVREGLAFETAIESDTCSLWPVVEGLLKDDVDIHCVRDLTRGGLASALVEISEAAQLAIEIDEPRTPICAAVRGACELLGLDPMYVANEGRLVAFVPAVHADRAVSIMRRHPSCAEACIIGFVGQERRAAVTARTSLDTLRLVDMFSGEQLPRIC